MDMMIDPSVQLAESGAAGAAATMTTAPLSLSQLFEEAPTLTEVISESVPPGKPITPRLSMSEQIAHLSANSAIDLKRIWASVDFYDPASLIALNMALGEYVAEASAASGITAAEARALKFAAEKI